jgi:hypothetical protein
MHTVGMVVSVCAFLFDGLLVLRGARSRLFRVFPLFYSYLVYSFCASLALYAVYFSWSDSQSYRSAFWINYLITILAEFMVLVEISDQVFRAFPAIRNLGRALTGAISIGFGLVYILPAVFEPASRSLAILDFSLRASITKAVILATLFYAARHYGSKLNRNVAGIMLGFSLYLAMNIVIMAAAKAFGRSAFAQILWAMLPAASLLCVVVWTNALWQVIPVAETSRPSGADPEGVALALMRFNSELSKILHK